MKLMNIPLKSISLIGANALMAGVNIAVIASGRSGIINWIAAIISSFMLSVLIWHAVSASREPKQEAKAGSAVVNTNLYFIENRKFGNNGKPLT
jgi:hypothetical protein